MVRSSVLSLSDSSLGHSLGVQGTVRAGFYLTPFEDGKVSRLGAAEVRRRGSINTISLYTSEGREARAEMGKGKRRRKKRRELYGKEETREVEQGSGRQVMD